jgi:putative addiction module component (TIGR02574 family)
MEKRKVEKRKVGPQETLEGQGAGSWSFHIQQELAGAGRGKRGLRLAFSSRRPGQVRHAARRTLQCRRIEMAPLNHENKGVESKTGISYTYYTMPITLEQIVEETRHWPPEKVGELVGRLTEDLRGTDPETEAAWQTEISRRVEEIQAGKVQGIPVEQSLARIRKIAGL